MPGTAKPTFSYMDEERFKAYLESTGVTDPAHQYERAFLSAVSDVPRFTHNGKIFYRVQTGEHVPTDNDD